jgi:hypothetical protein
MAETLANHDEILFRQIHPSCMHNGTPASDRFKPQPSDEGMMSVDRGSIATAAASHALYVGNGLQSAAVYGVAVGEFASESIACFDDPLASTETTAANPAHALADYTPHEVKKWKTISKRLWRSAVDRGQLHP